ncbi:hypothetical protein Daus18300_014514 [Diaporthe australafricana]|uniref:Uncharacterized protein n=1 Tax=Diaporthe australafricana TaxID=127596 RepID=A0ABR3VUW5_9PEZI
MAFDQLFPVFLSSPTPKEARPNSLPFKFVDGLNIDQTTIGLILFVQGIYQLFTTIFLFPFVVNRIGTLHLFRLLTMANAILLTNSALTLQTLGLINKVAASTASLCRTLGLTIAGALYAVGLSTGYLGLAWWCNGLVTIAGALFSFQITEPKCLMDAEKVAL